MKKITIVLAFVLVSCTRYNTIQPRMADDTDNLPWCCAANGGVYSIGLDTFQNVWRNYAICNDGVGKNRVTDTNTICMRNIADQVTRELKEIDKSVE